MNRASRGFRLLSAVLCWALCVLTACGNGTDGDNDNHASNAGTNGAENATPDASASFSCEAPWSGRVQASDRMRALSGVHSTAYALDQPSDEVRYEFFGPDDELLSSLAIHTEALGGSDTETPVWTAVSADGSTTTFHAEYVAPNFGDTGFIRTFLTHDDTAYEIWLWVDDFHQHIDRMWLAVADNGQGPSQTGWFIAEGTRYSVLELLDAGRLVDPEGAALAAWLAHYDLDEPLSDSGLASVRAFFDPPLVAQVRDHGTHCLSQPVAADIVQQALSTCVKAANCQPVNDTVSTVIAVLSFIVGANGVGAGALGLKGLGAVDSIGDAVAAVLPVIVDLVNWTVSSLPVNEAWLGFVANTLAAIGELLAGITGDPHLRTFDGLAFDFQAVGEFTAIDAPGIDPIVVQVRQSPLGEASCSDVSIVTAVAVRYNEQTIEIRRTRGEDNVYLVDGAPVTSPLGTVSIPVGGELFVSPSKLILGWPDGSVVEIRALRHLPRIDLHASLAPARAGNAGGLLGNFNGDWSDEPLMPDGIGFSNGMTANALYDVYGAAWRLNSEDSLFTYADGQDPDTFYDPAFPSDDVEASDFAPERYDQARAACIAAGVESVAWLDACIIDMACTEDESYAQALAMLDPPLGRLRLVDDGVTASGDLRISPVPASVLHDDFESDRAIRVFPEVVAVTLAAPLAVDRTSSGEVAASGDLESAQLTVGTRVRSYMAHLDPTYATPSTLQGTITFPTQVLGVIATADTLEASDGLIGARGTVYPRADRAPEFGDDSFVISADRLTVELRLGEQDGMDQLRIITAGGLP